jgi:hypothetical protein
MEVAELSRTRGGGREEQGGTDRRQAVVTRLVDVDLGDPKLESGYLLEAPPALVRAVECGMVRTGSEPN